MSDSAHKAELITNNHRPSRQEVPSSLSGGAQTGDRNTALTAGLGMLPEPIPDITHNWEGRFVIKVSFKINRKALS